MDKVESFPPSYRPRRFHWYIRQKECDLEPGTSADAEAGAERKSSDSTRDDLSELRFCRGGVSAKYLSNTIIIALIQEITVGLIFATRDATWYRDPQLIILAACRLLQFVPCFCALLGNYRNNASLVLPFLVSQVFIGSYADIQSYLLLLSDWQSASPEFPLLVSPLLYLALPIIIYAALLSLILYIQYKSMKFVNIKKNSMTKGMVDDTLIESLM